MVRGGGIATQRSGVPLRETNGGPPPSTIAAQIVNNHTHAPSREPEKRAIFGQLLQEYLKDPSSAEEPNPEVNAQLITVVAEGGLAVFNENPFDQQSLIPQAIDSIQVIELTIRRSPELILFQANSDDGSKGPRLFTSLFPKILNLVDRQGLGAIQEQLRSLLIDCFTLLQGAAVSWREATAVLDLYKHSVDALLSTFESITTSTQSFSSSSFRANLPPSDGISKFWPESQHLVALPQGCQTTISNISQALFITNTLIGLVAKCNNPDLKTSLRDSLSQLDTAWVFESCSRLWTMFKAFQSAVSNPDNRCFESEYLDVLGGAFKTQTNSFQPSFNAARSIAILTASYLDMLKECLKGSASGTMEESLTQSLMNLLLIIKTGPPRSQSRQAQAQIVEQVCFERIRTSLGSWAGSETLSLQHPGHDLKVALYQCLGLDTITMLPRRETEGQESPRLLDESSRFESETLRTRFSLLFLDDWASSSQAVDRPSKRVKLGDLTKSENRASLFQDPLIEWTKPHESSNIEMHEWISDVYQNLGSGSKVRFLTNLGMRPCAATQALEEIGQHPGDTRRSCSVCDSAMETHPARLHVDWNEIAGNKSGFRDHVQSLSALVALPREAHHSRYRILLTVAIGRMARHTIDAQVLDLFECALGKWCLKALTSSNRELRIAAGRAIIPFLQEHVPENVRTKNRRETLRFLKALSERNELAEQETLILAWSQVARVCGDEELNLALLYLVDCLGHANTLICGIAYNELSAIASGRRKSPTDLLKPFWSSIAITVVQTLNTRPQKAQLLADWLGSSVNQLLNSTQSETVPYLVLTKRKDVLQRIASARGSDTSVRDVCTHPSTNLAAILALLLCQSSKSVEASAMELLVEAAPEFRETTLPNLVYTEPILVAFEMLKRAADADEAKKAQIHHGFHTLTVMAESKRDKSKTAKKRILKDFFEKHILGIMAHITTVIDSPRDPRPVLERKQCLGAIEEMVKLAGDLVSKAVPQIRACLQCAFEEQRLCDRAFQVWIALLRVVHEEDLDILIDPTMSIIAQHWSTFSTETQNKAHDLVSDLFKENGGLIKDHIDTFPSLASIQMLSKFDGQISKRRAALDPIHQFDAFSKRLQDESTTVVSQALRELIPFFEDNQQVLHESAIGQKSGQTISKLARCLLDVRARYGEEHAEIAGLCLKALGLIGCVDPNQVEAVKEKQGLLVLSNFERATEVINFTAYLLEHILVKSFRSSPNSRAQGFLAFAMQELLRFGFFHQVVEEKPRGPSNEISYQKWQEMSEPARNTLIPFVSSMYRIQNNVSSAPIHRLFPTFHRNVNHSYWLRTFTFNLLQKGRGENAVMLFGVLSRVIRGHDLSIATFMLPYAALNVIIGGTDGDSQDLAQELLAVLQYERETGDQVGEEDLKQCSEILDYLSRWLHERRKCLSETRAAAAKGSRLPAEFDEVKEIQLISSVENVLNGIPAEVISKRAVECGSYARALFHWEQFMRQQVDKAKAQDTGLYDQESHLRHLQQIYSQIDEPDSIEGIAAHLTFVDPAQQVLEHRKAGRWTAAQSWYELSLAQNPDDETIQVDLLTCLKESGQYDSLLNCVESFGGMSSALPAKALPFAAEAAWVTGKWDRFTNMLSRLPEETQLSSQEFNMGVGKALLALRKAERGEFETTISTLREGISRTLTSSTVTSLHACHDQLLKLHVLYEIEAMSGLSESRLSSREAILPVLDQRLEVLGAYTSDKQYVLGARRAVMQLSKLNFTKLDQASSWLTSATLARKSEFSNTAYNAVLHAAQLGDDEAKIEHSKLLWKDGHQRKAIQNLRGAIETNAFRTREPIALEESAATVSVSADGQDSANRLSARANLLLTKWLDQAGQTQSNEITRRYQNVIISYARWDKGHYYLGKHYIKIFEAEKLLPRAKQSSSFLSGEHTKLVIDNYTRSMVYGAKYYYQTVPKVLTLWLDLGMEVHDATRRSTADADLANMRTKNLTYIHKQLQKYAVDRIPPYIFYTAFPQIITRISHPNVKVWEVLQAIIVKIAAAHPQQTLWALLAVVKSTASDRVNRGHQVLSKLKEMTRKPRPDELNIDLRGLITHAQRLTEQLLHASEVAVDKRITHVSLSRDLGFNMKLAPCLLVVPIEATMIASLPTIRDSSHVRRHRAFPRDAVTIQSFEDDVLVLSSLQRPRKLLVRGSNGQQYGLMCKPKDDLRKDQRLMEFNAMINRALQRDVESSKRQLYIKTYGVTPLNEECGTVEWVDNLKPIRDVIIRLYKLKNVTVDYHQISQLLDRAALDPQNSKQIFAQLLTRFPSVLHEWFIETFPEPSAWLTARHRYSRSTAVMSIVGHVLGLGDRHGENVLLDARGGIFHVDFNCLFDKGLTFEKPELVPFRLTHNMLDAMGPAGVEGAFRIAAESVLRICRAQTDTLMTILETFVHDPTTDFITATAAVKRRRKPTGVGADVPETPQEVLDAVQNKLKGLMKGDSVPLGVEGYVDALIRQARDERNLAAMYIGWCAFF